MEVERKEDDMVRRGGETLETFCAEPPSHSPATLLSSALNAVQVRGGRCVNGREAEGKHLSVSLQGGRGQAAAQCSAQLLSKLLSLCWAGLALSA